MNIASSDFGAKSGAKGDARSARPIRIVVIGHVDHGKSTLIGRLMHDTGSLPHGKVDELRVASARRGMPFEWSFVLDALQAERDQAITIDTTQIRFSTGQRNYVIIDAPGHREFLRNMISGASASDAAVLVIDVVEGVQEQTRRHGLLLQLLGIKEVVVVLNKMDLVHYERAAFDAVATEIASYLGQLGMSRHSIVPICAQSGEGLSSLSKMMPWYQGPSLTQALDGLAEPVAPEGLPLRLPVQDVYKFDHRRLIAGRIVCGSLSIGDVLLFSPSNLSARVRSIEMWNSPAPPLQLGAGESIAITLDEQIFVERGDVASHSTSAPMLTNVFRARLFWLGETPLSVGARFKLKLANREASVSIQAIEGVVDTGSLTVRHEGHVERHQIADVVIRCRDLLALDPHEHVAATGRFVLVDEYETVGGGVISMKGYPDQRLSVTVKSQNITAVAHRVSNREREDRNGHGGGTLWLTGLSGAGKSTIAMALEQELFRRGYHTYVLDGDNIRRGLNANLGFSPEDRAENIRRVGETAALFADAGFVVITAFISPYRADRERARQAHPSAFHEIYLDAPLEVCEQRDPKGLYRKSRAGEIGQFTGVSAPYEPPENPDVVLSTGQMSIQECVDVLMEYVSRRFALSGNNRS